MANVVALVAVVNKLNAPAGQYHIAGSAVIEGSVFEVPWEAHVDFTAGSTAINAACRDAAVAAVQAAGFTVEPSDQKTLFASAVIV